MERQKLMTSAQAAERLQSSKKLIYREIASGKLKCYKLGAKGIVRISEEQFQEYLEKVEK